MNKSQQSVASLTWMQELQRGAAITLPAAPRARRLRVVEGKLWLTLTNPADSSQLSNDEWLSRDDVFDLSAGESAVIESWPNARFEVLAPMSSLAA